MKKTSAPFTLFITGVTALITLTLVAYRDPVRSRMYEPGVSNLWDTLVPASNPDTLSKIKKHHSFPGGVKELERFFQYNLYPLVPEENNAPSGTYMVIIKCAIDVDGTLKEFEAVTHHGYGMEEEVIRVLKRSPKWEPALLENGQPVKRYAKFPVSFQVLETKGKKKKR